MYSMSQKSIPGPGVINYNLNNNCNVKKMLVMFNTHIFDITCHQMTVQVATEPNVCFCAACILDSIR